VESTSAPVTGVEMRPEPKAAPTPPAQASPGLPQAPALAGWGAAAVGGAVLALLLLGFLLRAGGPR
jgi:hypothetical protein